MKNLIKKGFIVFCVFLMFFFASYGVQNFTITPSTLSITVNTSQTGVQIFEILNTGDENLSLNINKENLVGSSSNIVLNLNETAVLNLEPTESFSFEMEYNSGSTSGQFQGNLTVVSSSNSSIFRIVPISMTVNEPQTNQPEPGNDEILELISPNIGFPGEGILRLSGQSNDRRRIDLRFENTGNQDIVISTILFSNLDGRTSSDRIRSSDLSFDTSSFTIASNDREIIELSVDIPRDISSDLYRGEFTLRTSDNIDLTWEIEVDVFSDSNDNVFVRDNFGDVRNNFASVTGETGESIRNILFSVENDAGVTFDGIYFELESDLNERNSVNTISRSQVSFSPTTLFNFRNRDSESIRMTIDIPTDAVTGTYTTDVNVLNSNGQRLDSFALEVRVVGDIFVREISVPENSAPGDLVDVKVLVRNQGSQLYRNVVLTGILSGLTVGGADIIETTPNFLLDVNEEEEKILRFRVPEDALHGTHTLEIRVQTGEEEVVEITRFSVNRPFQNIEIQSTSINPVTARCEDNLFSFMRVQNLGRFSEEIRFVSQIVGTDISQQSNLIDIGVNEVIQDTKILDITSLEPGSYTLLQRVQVGSIFQSRETSFEVFECEGSLIGGVDVNDLNQNNNSNSSNEDVEEERSFFDETNQTTIYLATAVGIVIILIIISLFFL